MVAKDAYRWYVLHSFRVTQSSYDVNLASHTTDTSQKWPSSLFSWDAKFVFPNGILQCCRLSCAYFFTEFGDVQVCVYVCVIPYGCQEEKTRGVLKTNAFVE